MSAKPKPPARLSASAGRIPLWWPNLAEIVGGVRAGAIEAGAVPESLVVTITPLDARVAAVSLQAERKGGGPRIDTGAHLTNEATAGIAREFAMRWMREDRPQ